jgi:predicted SprT family Zn-dependent metalloprotease
MPHPPISPRRTSKGLAGRRDLTKYLRLLGRAWRYPGVLQLQFRFNRRLTKTVARLLASDGIIECNPTVARLDTRNRREVICHEAAHFVVWQRRGLAVRPHGSEWVALVKLAGFEPKATRAHCGQPPRRPAPKQAFRHTCPVCHFSRRAARRMPRWRCPECRAIGLDGPLRIERISR